ncbi:MAG: porphobilinogen synthase, partial [Rhodospirillales bacterium]
MATSGWSYGRYPARRMRRNRQADWNRRLVAENRLSPSDLIWPLFVRDGKDLAEPIPSMPGVARHSLDRLAAMAKRAQALGIPAIALFPYTDPAVKTPDAREALNPDNLVCRAVREVKNAVPDIGIVCDVALDPYNADGHDGLVRDGKVLNDETIALLCEQAVVQAEAGCD